MTMRRFDKPKRPFFDDQVAELEQSWAHDPRWSGVERSYAASDVVRLRGSVGVTCSIAEKGANDLWRLLHTEEYIHTLWARSPAARPSRW